MKLTVTALTLLGLLLSVSPVMATPILEDDFPGTSLDTSKWDVYEYSSGSVSVTDSRVHVGPKSNILSKTTINPADGAYTIELTDWDSEYEDSIYMGLTDDTDVTDLDKNTVIQVVLSKGSPSYVRFRIRIDGSDYQAHDIELSSGDFDGDWTLTASSSRITLLRNGTELLDTDDTAPDGGGSWVIPTVDLSFFLRASSTSSDTYLDKISITPEPASLCLLAAGGALVVIKRRRK